MSLSTQPQLFALLEYPAGLRQRRGSAYAFSVVAQLVLAAGLAHWVPAASPIPRRPPVDAVITPLFVPPRIRPIPPTVMIPKPLTVRRLTPPAPAKPRLAPVPLPNLRLRLPTPPAAPVTAPMPRLRAPALPPAPVVMGSFHPNPAVAPKVTQTQVRAAGFGDPHSPVADRPTVGNVAAAGFNLPAGPAGASQAGAVAVAGFGAVTAGGNPAAGGHLAASGFGDASAGSTDEPTGTVQASGFAAAPAAALPTPTRAAAPVVVPVEILFKPEPVYSAEARRLHIEGEVVVQVVFAANGEIRVGSVVQGLGHGLDKAALAAAARIRFVPARRGGSPIETQALVHVQFQLANE